MIMVKNEYESEFVDSRVGQLAEDIETKGSITLFDVFWKLGYAISPEDVDELRNIVIT